MFKVGLPARHRPAPFAPPVMLTGGFHSGQFSVIPGGCIYGSLFMKIQGGESALPP